MELVMLSADVRRTPGSSAFAVCSESKDSSEYSSAARVLLGNSSAARLRCVEAAFSVRGELMLVRTTSVPALALSRAESTGEESGPAGDAAEPWKRAVDASEWLEPSSALPSRVFDGV